MENDNTQGTSSAKKAPLVKRIKVPTVRKEMPPAQPAQQRPAPATVKPEQSAPEETGHIRTKEPSLPPEDNGTNTNPAAEKPSSKRHRNAPVPDAGKKSILPELDEEKKRQITKIKAKTKSFLSGFLVRLFIFILLIIVICAGIYSALPTIAEKKLPELFAANGMPFKKFKLKELTVDTMVLTNISDKAGKMSISSMTFNYSLINLYTNNAIRSLKLSGVTLTGEKRNDGISLGVLDDFIRSPLNAKKGTMLSINSLEIQNGTFVLKSDTPPETIVNENGETEEVDNTVYIKFSATGSLGKAGLNMKISTDHTSPQMILKTETVLNKTSLNAQIKTEITEGNVLKNDEKIGSITGKLEVAVNDGILSTGSADLLLLSSSQKLKLNAKIIPKGSSFDVMLDLDRSFDNPQDAVGKFVGLLSLKANDIKVNGTFQQFKGDLPLRINAPVLTNNQTSVRDMTAETDLTFSCSGTNCTALLKKPMKFAFSGMQTTGLYKKINFFKPLELTINPDPKEPFLKFKDNILSIMLPAEGFQTQLQMIDDRSSSTIAVALNGLKARINYNVFTGAYSGDAIFQQSGYMDKNFRMTGIQGITSFTSNTLPEARLLIAKGASTTPDLYPEFSADIRFRPQNQHDFGVDSTVHIQNGLISAKINGSYSLASRECDFYIVVPKFMLSEDGIQLKSALPFLSKYLAEDTVGTFAAKGRFAVKDGNIYGPMNILLENVDTSWKNIKFNKVNGVITLSSLLPVETPSNQQIFVGMLNAGLPFQNAVFNFQIASGKGIDVANARMKYADGQFKSIKSFLIPFDNKPSRFLLEGNGINLSLITNDLKSPSLRMDGILNSEWQLTLTDTKELNIDQAVFSTKMPGTLHFTPSKELQNKMDPQMQAFLKDVIVKNMKITAKGPIDGAVSFDVSITGHTPLETSENDQDVSFDFKGDFRSFLKQETRGYVELPPDILQALQSFSK